MRKNAPNDKVLKKKVAKAFILRAITFVLMLCGLQATAQTNRITGKVTDSAGAPLSGASVTVKGGRTGTATDAGGNFTISASSSATLVITALGYASTEVPVNGRTQINTSLFSGSTQALDQVVVVGYGSQRKIDVTGSVVSVKGEELAKQASINPIGALQGKVAGVQITNSGAPGASPQVRVRGTGTVYGNPNPLYVVDGVWFDDISFLNPSDIDNLSVLKDASSQSIYGIRAANGVVLITTKRGRNGKAIVTYTGSAGWQKTTNPVKMANATEYATLINEKLAAVPYSQRKPAQFPNPSQYGEGTNWYNQVLRDALQTNHQIGISGGSEKSTYNFSVGYLRQDGIVKTNNYTRVTAKLQQDVQALSALKVGYTVLASSGKSDDIPGGIFRQLYAASPLVPVKYADGTYGDPNDYSLGEGANFNPQATLDFYDQQSKNWRVTGNIYGELRFAKHFLLRSSIGGEFGENETKNFIPVYRATVAQRRDTSFLTVARAENRNWILENTLTYDNTFGEHKIRVLAGQGSQRYQAYGITASVKNVPDTRDGDRYLTLGNQDGRFVTDYGDLSTVVSYFGRVNYSFANKYLINASMRADGSSKFSADQRWGYFPSVGAGWVISSENFMKNQTVFNTLKLKGSWGKIGNASVPSSISTLLVNQGAYLSAVYGGQVYTGASITQLTPPTIVWERGVGTDIGLEASLLRNRLSIELDFYNKKTERAIFAIPILGSLGTNNSQLIGNQASFQNRGIELAIGWRGTVGKDISYSINANGALNNNKVLEVSTGANPIYAGGGGSTGGTTTTRTVLGQPIGQFFGRQVVGVFQDSLAVVNYKNSKGVTIQPGAVPGDFKYADINDDGVIDDKDRVVLGNPNPKYTYGINTNFSYKQWDLTVDFQGVAGVSVYNANAGLRYGNENYTKDFFDHRWHGAGTSNTYPNANIGGNANYIPNSFFVESGSYFRVRNMQLGYTFSNTLIKGISRLRAYVTAQNAFNFFKYKGFSPEIIGGSPIASNIDVNVYPLQATYLFGVNVTF